MRRISQLLEDFDLGRNIQKLRNRRIYDNQKWIPRVSQRDQPLKPPWSLSGPEPLETTQNPTLIY